MSAQFSSCFILAAGEGRRMRPFTDHTPKPMAKIGGETLIARAIDQCRTAGIDNIVVNSHHLAEKLEHHIGDRARVIREDALLDTGGGIKNILSYMPPDKPFYCISGDSWWMDGKRSVFEQMDKVWRDNLDLLIVLQKITDMHVTAGNGDYHLENNVPHRARHKNGMHMFTSHRIIHPRLFVDTPDTPFSFLTLMDKAETEGRLGAIELDGIWQHLTNVQDIENVNAWLEKYDD